MLVLLLVAGSAAKADPVDESLAREVGAKFIKANTPLKSATVGDMQWAATYRTSNDVAAFHVFNTPKGFVIVAADDCAHPILGYSDEGSFNANDIPVQMQAYLSGFVEQIEYGIEHRVADPEIAREWQIVRRSGLLHEERATTAVAPLLTTMWNQNCYYNNLCPDDASGPCSHVYAGCVATAMAQIMKYWNYPITGTGSHTYTPDGYPEQTANFGATTYNWANMPNTISASSSSTQLNAVATLIWHCGVSVDMMYGPNGSGAYSNDVPYALTNYFGYSDDAYYTNRGDDDAAWLAQVKACLDQGRPVYYSAVDSQGQGGHAFVCDGYNANNQLHFNWGWSGSGNNYFALNALNVNGFQFNSNHAAVFDIHPNCTVGTNYQVTATASPSNGGTVTGAGTYPCGAGCTLTATPAEGYMFCAWTENGVLVSTDPTYGFTVMGSRNLVANFYPSTSEGCTIVFALADSYGDGWNGNQLTVNYSDGCITSEQLTIENGSSATFTRNVVDGCHITLGWIMGQWASECSFTVSYGDGTLIYYGSSLNSSFYYGFDVNCGGTPPVEDNLTYSVNGDGVSVTVTGHVNGTAANGPLVIPATTTINGVTYMVTAIGNDAFQHYNGITSLTFGSSVASIGSSAFWDCQSLEAVYYTGTIADWCNISFADYDANPIKSADELYIGGTLVTNLVIPEGVTNVKKYAFTHYNALTSVSFPSSLNIIGQSAFGYCHGLTSIVIPSAVYSIGNYAFSDCSALGQIVVQSGNANYDSRNNCNAIIVTNSNELLTGCKNTVVPATVSSISGGAFAGCTGLTGEFIVPDAVTYIGPQAFQLCTNLSSVVIGNGVTSIGNSAFNSCTSLTSVTIGNSLASMYSYVFANCYNLASIQIDCETPPSATSYDFYGVDKSIPLMVPYGTSGAYQNATGWSEFTNIQENSSSISITATANPVVGGTVSGAGYYSVGDICTLTASANADYAFTNWTKDGVQVSTNATYSFTVNGSGSYVANFEYTGEPPTASILIEEHFDGSSLPSGWSISGLGTSNWSISASNNAGGTANEMHLTWSPQFNGISRLVMPPVNLTGIGSVGISFKHALDNFSGTNTIGIATSSDNGTTWHDVWSQGYNTSSMWTVSEAVSSIDMGLPSVRFCIYFSGNSYNINDWYFDDIQIFTLTNLDLGVTAIDMPDYLEAGTQTISFDVLNYGVTTVTSLQATYELDGESVTQSFSVNIPSMGSATLGFNTTANMVPGTHELTVSLNSVNGTTDDNSLNDELTKTLSVALGIVERIPMIEHFSSSTCSPCANVNATMLNFCNNNPGRFTYTKYQMNWPGNGDPYYTNEGGTRRTFYSVNAVPNLVLDGENYSTYMSQGDFDEEAGKPALMDIRGSFSVSGNTISVKADIMPYIDADARVYISVNEKVTTGNVGTNGETEFHHIFMKMLPDAQGTSVSLTASQMEHLEYSFNMSSTHVEEMGDLEVAIWVQNYSTKEVFNSRFAYEYTNVHPYPVQNLSLAGNGNTFVATWNAPSQGTPTGYRIYVNGQVAVESTTAMSYSFNGTGDYYTVGVQALYGGGKTSVIVFEGCSNEPGTSCLIQAVASPSEAGGIAGAGTYYEGQTCTLSATANAGYEFVNWTKDGVEVSTSTTYTFTVTEDAAFVAHFASEGYYWDYDHYAYPDNMTVTGVIQIEGVEQRSRFLEVGAFCNGDCRGRERPTYISAFDRYVMFFSVYGTDGDQIEFRLYDHATGMESTLACETVLTFHVNDIYGDLLNPFALNFVGADMTQTASFASGWNWWSGYVELGSDGLNALESGLGTSGLMIKSQNDGYASYLDGFGWYGSLNSINNESTYQVKTNAACAVELTGTASNPSNHPITLHNGWTWVGYPVSMSMGISDVLSGITPSNGDMLKSQNDGYASYLAGYGWYGSLNTITPGMGLMYKSNNTADVILVYPNGGTRTDLKANLKADGNHFVPNLNAYPDNMSVMAVVELNDEELRSESYELAAFANGEVRGSVSLNYVEPLDRYMAFLTVAGEDVTELTFGLYDAETGMEVMDCTQVLSFSVNAVAGSFAEPYVVSFRGTTALDEFGKSLQVYPNPVAAGDLLNIGMANDGSDVRVEIVNALGAVVSVENSTKVAATFKAPSVPGIYTVRITAEGKGTYCRKLVVR